jgi:hypothetical protein
MVGGGVRMNFQEVDGEIRKLVAKLDLGEGVMRLQVDVLRLDEKRIERAPCPLPFSQTASNSSR